MYNFSFLGFCWGGSSWPLPTLRVRGLFECQNVAFFSARQCLFFFSYSYSRFTLGGWFQDTRLLDRTLATLTPGRLIWLHFLRRFPRPRFLEIVKKSFACFFHLRGAVSLRALITNSVWRE